MEPTRKSTNYILYVIFAAIVVTLIVAAVVLLSRNNKPISDTVNSTKDSTTTGTATEIDLTKLPLGDQKYSSSPKVGYIYLCNTNLNGGGADEAGPWIDQSTKTWDMTQKIIVDGNVAWSTAQWQVNLNNTTRNLVGNGLPAHETGVYPISTNDDAYQYDRNPNSIKSQTINLSLPANPTTQSSPSCIGGEVGVMLSGIPLFNGFDAAGRDAAAWEIQDKCDGHPQATGQYHYHSASSCVDDESETNEHSELVGYALDGFGIFGKKGENGVTLSTQDLDECHGETHTITWDGKQVEMYHYHLTDDFPYSVSCFKGKATNMMVAPGGTQQTNQQMPPRKR